MRVQHSHCIGGYSPEFYLVASRMKKNFNIILFRAVKMSGIFFFFFSVVSFMFCFPEKEQSINRAGIVQEDIQPAGILDSCVCVDSFKDLLEVRPEYLYRFK